MLIHVVTSEDKVQELASASCLLETGSLLFLPLRSALQGGIWPLCLYLPCLAVGVLGPQMCAIPYGQLEPASNSWQSSCLNFKNTEFTGLTILGSQKIPSS